MTNTYYVAGIPFSSYNSLVHHGIKGQKWGIRRYQNEDGSLTAEGQKRYESGINKLSKEHNAFYKGREYHSDEKKYLDAKKQRDSTIGKKFRDTIKTSYDKNAYNDDYKKAAEERDKALKERNRHVLSNLLLPDSKNKYHQAYLKAESVLSDTSTAGLAKFMDESFDSIKKLPKSKQRAAYAYVAEYLGFDL